MLLSSLLSIAMLTGGPDSPLPPTIHVFGMEVCPTVQGYKLPASTALMGMMHDPQCKGCKGCVMLSLHTPEDWTGCATKDWINAWDCTQDPLRFSSAGCKWTSPHDSKSGTLGATILQTAIGDCKYVVEGDENWCETRDACFASIQMNVTNPEGWVIQLSLDGSAWSDFYSTAGTTQLQAVPSEGMKCGTTVMNYYRFKDSTGATSSAFVLGAACQICAKS